MEMREQVEGAVHFMKQLRSGGSAVAASGTLLAGAAGIMLLLIGGSALGQDEAMQRINPRMGPPIAIDAAAVDAAGIRRIESKYLVLYTDLPDEQADQFPGLFDQAVPQWCERFDVSVGKTRSWRLSAFLMRDRERFRMAGLLPDDLPDFPTGYNRGHHFWIVEQPGNYYTRHLLLHEGTHAFMQWFLGGSGPAWYSEGTAELLGLHRIDGEGQLALGFPVASREECEFWERPAVIQRAVAAGNRRTLGEVLDMGPLVFDDLEGYAWSWAACEFLSGHPLSSRSFSAARGRADDVTPQFNLKLRRALRDEWPGLERDWRLFVEDMEYALTAERSRLTAALPISGENDAAQFTLECDHGWQSTGIRIEAGKKIQIEPSGRFTVAVIQQADEEKKWPCEAGGITLEYWRGRPLGILLAGVLVDSGERSAVAEVQQCTAIGTGGELEFTVDGELLLRINENPARMNDNEGNLTVRVRQ